MKKTDEAASSENGPRKKAASKKAFKNFAEYWHFTKDLPDYQRDILVDSMSRVEQRALRASYEKGGWFDLFMRNTCDEIVNEIKDQTGVDLIDIRVKVVSGKPQLMHKAFWEYVNNCFHKISWEHIAYIFDDVIVKDHDEDYIKLIKFEPEN
jgi:hypothetical protein